MQSFCIEFHLTGVFLFLWPHNDSMPDLDFQEHKLNSYLNPTLVYMATLFFPLQSFTTVGSVVFK